MQPTSPAQPPAQQPTYPYPYSYPYQQGTPGPYGPPQPVPMPLRKPSHALRNAAIILTVLIVIGGGVLAVEYRAATLVLTVTSNHFTNTISYILSVDGNQVDSGTLTPGQSVDKSVAVSWWVDNCQIHSATATSSGGALGPETDTVSGIVCSGQSYTGTLSV